MNIKKTIIFTGVSLLLSNAFNSAYSAHTVEESNASGAGGGASSSASSAGKMPGDAHLVSSSIVDDYMLISEKSAQTVGEPANLELNNYYYDSSSVLMSAQYLKVETNRSFSKRFHSLPECQHLEFLGKLNSILDANMLDENMKAFPLAEPVRSFVGDEFASPFLKKCHNVNVEFDNVLRSITNEMLGTPIFQSSLLELVNATAYALATIDLSFNDGKTYRMSGFISNAVTVLGKVEHSHLEDFATELFRFLGIRDREIIAGRYLYRGFDTALIISMLAQVPKDKLNSDFLKEVSKEEARCPMTVGAIGRGIEELLK